MKQHKKGLVVWLLIVAALFGASLLAGLVAGTESVQDAMTDAVLQDTGQTGLLGVGPGMVFAFVMTVLLLLCAVLIRAFVIPRFQILPGRLQLALEAVVGLVEKLLNFLHKRFHRSQAPAELHKGHSGSSAGGKAKGNRVSLIHALRPWMRQHKKGVAVWLAAVAVLFAAALLIGPSHRSETVQEAMRDAVLHDINRVSLFGLKEVNPGMISALLVTAFLLLCAALIRAFAIPRFKPVPGRLQLLVEEAVKLFDGMARANSPHRNGFMGLYIFAAGVYIFVSTLFELLGLQAITVNGHPITLPAPLSDVNAAIAMGTLSFLVIGSGAVAAHGPKGVLKALKEFSLPISMSFRLFGALLSGLLVTELVYYFVSLSFVLPVVVGVLFTLLHALIQTYVLTMLVALYYGEVSEPEHGA